MAAIVLYFQLHQPYRLRRYTVFDTHADYFDDAGNSDIAKRVAERCYIPASQILTSCAKIAEGRFKFALSVTASLLEQLESYAPEALRALQELVATGCVELLSETAYHSLSFLFSRQEFKDQLDLHSAAIKKYFPGAPCGITFRNTELIYNNDVAHVARKLGYKLILTESAPQVMHGRSACQIFKAKHTNIAVLTRDSACSDDIAFKFTRSDLPGYPVTAAKLAQKIPQEASVAGIFLDYETFGEHHWQDTGILNFLESLPQEFLNAGHTFVTPAEAQSTIKPTGQIDVPDAISWADTSRDVSTWLGNAMQTSACRELYRLEARIKRAKDDKLLADWRRLTASDHVYYMSTKHYPDAGVHHYFSPYESPYDAYINFMNVLDNLRARL